MINEKLVFELESFLKNEGIDAFGWVDFENCRVTNERLLNKNYPKEKPESALMFLIPYYIGDSDDRNVSLYAVSRDYHIFLRELTERLEKFLGENAALVKGFADHSPIDERSAAVAAGLGDIGDNHLLINEDYGTYVFIGEFLCSFRPSDFPEPHNDSGCIHCGRCRRSCPSPDSCLSFLTQQKGELSPETVSLMRRYNTAWGCDICQTVCPLNSLKKKTPIPFFYEKVYMRAEDALAADDPDRAYYWRGKNVIERNVDVLKNENNKNEDNRPIRRQAWIYRT